ncbi:unnamed protein product [Camellia sinensis]
MGKLALCLWSSNPGDDIYVLEFLLPVNNKVGGNVMTSLMKEILGTMKKKIQCFKLASGEELGEELILSSGEELGEEFSEVTDFHNGEKLNSVQISQTRPELLQNGADLMELEPSDQQSMDAVNNESNVISAERSNSTCSQGKGTRKKLKRKQNTTGGKIEIFLEDILQTSQMRIEDAAKSLHVSISTLKRAFVGSLVSQGIEIPLEDVLQASEMSLDNAANSLHVSKSTLKCVCRGYGIEKWPPSKRTKFSWSQPFDEKQIQKLDYDMSSNQAWDMVTLTKPHNAATKDAEIVTIKAKYGNDVVIKFRLSLSSGLVELQQQVAQRLKLDPRTYHIKYKDEEDDLIVIACDADLLELITISRTSGNTTIWLLLEPITQSY